MISIMVKDAQGNVLASTSHETEALLAVDRNYQPGDLIEITSSE